MVYVKETLLLVKEQWHKFSHFMILCELILYTWMIYTDYRTETLQYIPVKVEHRFSIIFNFMFN